MSFILDALKKSETERRRQSVPGLMDPGIALPRARLPFWAIALAVLLVINLLLLTFVLLRGTARDMTGQNPQTAPAAPAATAAAAPGEVAATADVAADHFSPLDAPVYAPEIPAPSAGETAIPRPATARPSRTNADSGTHEVRRRDPILTEDYSPEDAEVLPTISELSLSGAQALPELHLDVHVFATKPSDRFVYINMHKYHENATLEEGPTVERIRRDGVILSYQGLRFLLPRQN